MKSQKFLTITHFLIFLFAAFIFASCSSAPELTSKWRQGEIKIDGLDNEWQGDLNYFEKEKIAVGIKNDSENLYFSIKTIDRETQMKIVRGGMTVWFDSTGGEKKIFGIHFPLGAGELAGAGAPTHTRGSREAPDPTNDYTALEERFSKTLQNLEIIGPGPVDKEQLSVESSYKTRGIKVGMRDTMGSLFYEVVIPLRTTASKYLAIGSDTGKIIGIGILTESTRRSQISRLPDEGAPNGGAGAPGMGGGTMGGGMGGGRRGGGGKFGQNQESASPIELWMKVKIASGK
jgi:hypothetical protein